MTIEEKDYLLRQLMAFAEGLRKCAALVTDGRKVEALYHLESMARDIFGDSLWSMLDSVDSSSAADMIADTTKLEMYARLVEQEAGVRAMIGDPEKAKELRVRALELYLEWVGRSPPPDEATSERIRELGLEIDRDLLDERYHARLDDVER